MRRRCPAQNRATQASASSSSTAAMTVIVLMVGSTLVSVLGCPIVDWGMNRLRAFLLCVVVLAAATAVSSLAAQAGPAAGILISRQLAESRGLRPGDIVQLSPDRTPANARPFRIAGIYEPTPDPRRFAQQRHEAR